MSHHRRAAGGSPPALRLLAAAACAASLAAGVVHAQTTYEVLGGSFVEESGGVAADVVIVAGADGEDRSTLVTTSVLANELHVYDRGYLDAVSVGGVVDFLTVGSGGGINTSSLSATNLSITGSDSSVVVSGSATVYSTLTLSGGGSLAVAGGLTVGGSGLAEIQVSQGSALVTGTLDSIQGIIDVRDGGSVTLGGAATLGGGAGPALRISSTTGSPAVFTANAPVSFAGGATSLDLGAGGLLVVNANVAAGSIGNVSGNSAVTINSGTFALGTAGGAAGFSTLSFGDANPLTLAGGRLEVGRLAFSGSGAVVRTGGTIASGSLSVANGAVTLAAGDFVGGSPDGYGGGDVVTVGGGGVLTVQGSIDASNSMSPGNITVSEGGRLVIDGGSITATMSGGSGVPGYGTLSVSGSNGMSVTNGGSYSVDFLELDGASAPAGDIRRGITLTNGATLTSAGTFALDTYDLGSNRILSISTGSNAGIAAPGFSVGNGVGGTVSIWGRSVSASDDGIIGPGSLDLSVNQSGTVTVVGSQAIGSLSISGTGIASSRVAISGTASLDNLTLGAGGRLVVNAPVDAMGSSLGFASGGELVLNANFDARDAFMSGASAVTINSGTLDVNPVSGTMDHPALAFTTANPLVLNGGRLSGGAISFSGSASLVRSAGVLDIGPLSVSNAAVTLLAGDAAGRVNAASSPQGSNVTVGSGGVLTVQGRIDTSAYQMPGDITVSNGGWLILDGGTISARRFDSSGGYGTLSVSGSNGIAVTNGGRYDVDELVLDNGATLSADAGSVARSITLDNGATLVSSGPFVIDRTSITSSNGGGIDAPSFTVYGNVGGMLATGRAVYYAPSEYDDLELSVGGTVSLLSGTLGMLSIGGTLEINGPVTGAGSVTVSGSGGRIVVNDTFAMGNASSNLEGTAVTMNSGTFTYATAGLASSMSFTAAHPLTMAGGRLVAGGLSLSGSGALVRTGGSLAVASLSVASGSYTLAAGDVVNAGVSSQPGGGVTVGSGGTLTLQGSIDTTSAMFDGNVVVDGGGRLIVAGGGITAGAGSISVNGGQLVLSNGTITALNDDLSMGGANGTLSIGGSNAFVRTGGNYLVDALSIGGGASVAFASGDVIRAALTIGDDSLLTAQIVLEILGQEPWSMSNTPGSLSIASGGELRLTAWTSEFVPSYGEDPGTTVIYGLKMSGNHVTELAAMLADGRITGTNQAGTLGVYYADPVLIPGSYNGTTYLTTTAVPEPSTLALAGLGVASAWRFTRRRRRGIDGDLQAHASPR
jgi:hypothetical protein